MTEPRRIVGELLAELNVVSHQLAAITARMGELDRTLTTGSAAPVLPQWQASPPGPPVPPAPAGYWQPWPQPAAPAAPITPPRTRDSSWIGKLLAVAGVAVTLIGVVLLLVLAAQAGLLRPEIRVAGGAVLAAALAGVGIWWYSRPGGRVGAVALLATGVAAAYLDVVAVTVIYDWVIAPGGLVLASLVAAGGLVLARRWDSEPLGLLILVPLIGLAPVLTGGVDLTLVTFMLALSVAALPVQLGRDWLWMHAARIAAATLPLLAALGSSGFGEHPNDWLLAGGCALAAVLAIVSGLILLPATGNPGAVAALSAAGTLPVLAAAVAVDRVLAASLAAALAAGMLAVVLLVTGLPAVARNVFVGLAAVAAVIAVTVAFDGRIGGPVLLGLGIVVALAARDDVAARWAAVGLGAVGLAIFLGQAPPDVLVRATAQPTGTAVATLAASLLVIGWVPAVGWAFRGRVDTDGARALAALGGAVAIYAVTAFTVTAGVLAFGTGGGFLAGHVAATLCWLALAAALFGYALRLPSRESRTAPISVGLALTAAAMAKLFLFDLGTLDGMFRVAVFLVAGLILLGMGAGYARTLARQDRPQP